MRSSVDPFLAVRSRAVARVMFATLRTALFKMHAAAARPRTLARKRRRRTPPRRRHAPSLSTQKAADTRRCGGGCGGGCRGTPRRRRVGGHAACAAAAHGERVGGSAPSGGPPSRGRLASLHDTRALQERVARRRHPASRRAAHRAPRVLGFRARPEGVCLPGGRRGCPVWRDATEHAGIGRYGTAPHAGRRCVAAVPRSHRPAGPPGVEDDAPPYAPNSAPYQNFAGRLSTWSTCTCFTSVYSRMPSRPNSRPMPLCL